MRMQDTSTFVKEVPELLEIAAAGQGDKPTARLLIPLHSLRFDTKVFKSY